MEILGKNILKNGNFSRFYLGKVEILELKSLEKWKFQPILPWKSGNFERNLHRKMEILGYSNILQKDKTL